MLKYPYPMLALLGCALVSSAVTNAGSGLDGIYRGAGPECSDGVDNDGDGLTDWQFDLGCTTLADNSEGGLPGGTRENGWTVYEPSLDTVIYYVSRLGDDSWSGLLPEPNGSLSDGPKRTIPAATAALRADSSDWVLLRRGDTFSDRINLLVSGRSPEQPIVVASYGSEVDPPWVTNEVRMHGQGQHLSAAPGLQSRRSDHLS